MSRLAPAVSSPRERSSRARRRPVLLAAGGLVLAAGIATLVPTSFEEPRRLEVFSPGLESLSIVPPENTADTASSAAKEPAPIDARPPSRAKGGARSKSTSRPAGARKPPDCDPPYTEDATGFRTVKRECL